MRAIAERGGTLLLTDAPDPRDPAAQGVIFDPESGSISPEMPIQAILARGYWQDVPALPKDTLSKIDALTKGWDEAKHPRDEDGRFSSGGALTADEAQQIGDGKTPRFGSLAGLPICPYSQGQLDGYARQGQAWGNGLLYEQQDQWSEWTWSSHIIRETGGVAYSELGDALAEAPKMPEGSLVYRGFGTDVHYQDESGNPISPGDYWSEQVGKTLNLNTLNSGTLDPSIITESGFGMVTDESDPNRVPDRTILQLSVADGNAAITDNTREREVVLSPGSYQITGVISRRDPAMGDFVVISAKAAPGQDSDTANWHPRGRDMEESWDVEGEPKGRLVGE